MSLTPATVTHGAVLRYLRDHPGAASAEIAEATGKLANNITRDLPKLADLVDPETRTLTPVGLAAVAALDRAEGKGDAAGGGLAGFVALEHRQIDPDPDQPRKDFGEKVEEGEVDPIEELAGSIVLDGLLEPLVVRPNPNSQTGDGLPRYVLIAGERRWRAIRRAQEAERLPFAWPIPCHVKDVDAATVKRLALIENLQRKDLKPLEEARAIQGYIDLTGEGTATIAAQLNRTIRFVQRRLQLLDLPPEKQKALEAGKLTLEEAWRWLANRPTVPELPARQWLIALEILDKALSAPLDPAKVTPSSEVEVGPEADDDEDLKAGSTYPLYLTHGPYEIHQDPGHVRTGRYKVSLSSYGGVDKLRLRFGESALTDAAVRATEIAKLRAELGIDFPLAEGPSIAWLKGPFEVAKAVLDEIAAEQAERKRREQARRTADAQAAVREAETLSKAQHLRARSQAGETEGLRAELAEVAIAAGVNLPVSVLADGSIVDATGAKVIQTGYYGGGAPPALIAKHTLVAVAMNAAAGFASPNLDEGPATISEAAFAQMIADAIVEIAATSESLVGPPSDDRALHMAEAGLEAYLNQEGIEFGDDDFDWSEGAARDLALGVIEDGLGQGLPVEGAEDTRPDDAHPGEPIGGDQDEEAAA